MGIIDYLKNKYSQVANPVQSRLSNVVRSVSNTSDRYNPFDKQFVRRDGQSNIYNSVVHPYSRKFTPEVKQIPNQFRAGGMNLAKMGSRAVPIIFGVQQAGAPASESYKPGTNPYNNNIKASNIRAEMDKTALDARKNNNWFRPYSPTEMNIGGGVKGLLKDPQLQDSAQTALTLGTMKANPNKVVDLKSAAKYANVEGLANAPFGIVEEYQNAKQRGRNATPLDYAKGVGRNYAAGALFSLPFAGGQYLKNTGKYIPAGNSIVDVTRHPEYAPKTYPKGTFSTASDKIAKIEIDDSQAKILLKNYGTDWYNKNNPFIKTSKNTPGAYDKQSVSLDKVIKHDKLFGMYPELKKYKVEIDDSLKFADQASLDTKTKTIKLNRYVVDNPDLLKGTLLHEIQHGIQTESGFAKGGSIKTVFSLKNKEYREGLRRESEIIDKISQKAEVYYKKHGWPKSEGDTFKFEADPIVKKLRSELKEVKKIIGGYGQNPEKGYRSLAGEIEARTVDFRRNMTPAERLKNPPYADQGILPDNQIVRFGSDKVNNPLKENTEEIKRQISRLVQEKKSIWFSYWDSDMPSDKIKKLPEYKRITKQIEDLKSQLDDTDDIMNSEHIAANNNLKNEVSNIIEGKPGQIKQSGLLVSAKKSDKIPVEVSAINPSYSVRHNKELWNTGGQKLYELGDDGAHQFMVDNPTDEGVAVGWRLFEKRLANGDEKGAQELLSDMAIQAIESGRRTQAWAMIARLDPKYMAMRVERSVKLFESQASDRMKGRVNWNAKVQNSIITKAKNIADENIINKIAKSKSVKSISRQTGITDKRILADIAKTRDLTRIKDLMTIDMQKEIHGILPSTFGEKALTTWKAFLLSKPATHVRNILGNTVNYGTETATTPLASIYDRTLGRALTPTKQTVSSTLRVGKGTGKKTMQDLTDSIKYGTPAEDAGGKYMLREINWNQNNPAEKYLFKPVTNFIYRTLGAEDKVFKTPGVATAMFNMADAAANTAGVKGAKKQKWIQNWIKNAPQEIKDQAKKEGGARVFQKDTVVSKAMSSMKRGLENAGYGPAAKGIDYVQPFVNVPAAIGSELLTYTPAGLARVANKGTKAKIGKNFVGKKIAGDSALMRDIWRREAMKDLAKSTVGTGIIAGGVAAGMSGDATGKRPASNTAESEQWKLENKQPNSIRVGNKWVNINSVGPQATLFNAAANTGANVVRAQKKGDLEKQTKLASALDFAGNIGTAWLDQSALTGIKNLQEVIAEPSKKLKYYVGQQLSSPVPNIIRGVASGMDPYQRENNSVWDGVANSIPGLRNTLTPQRDVLGNPLPNNAYGWGGLKAQVDPFNISTIKENPLAEELGRTGATPAKLKDEMKLLGQELKLTPQQLNELEQQSGGMLSDQLNKTISGANYQNASDENKKKVLSSVISAVRNKSKSQFITQGGVSTNGLDTSKLNDKAEIDLARLNLEGQPVGSRVKVKDSLIYVTKDGTVAIKKLSKIKSEADAYQLQTDMANAKESGDLGAWNKLAEQKIQNMIKEIDEMDPEADAVEILRKKNEIENLIGQVAKYKGQGGFKKAKKLKVKKPDAPQKPKLVGLKEVNAKFKLPTSTKGGNYGAAKKPTSLRGKTYGA